VTFDEVCQLLVREPFNLGFDEIAELTDYQILEILFKHPSDEKPQPEGAYQTHEEIFWSVWRRRGLSEDEIAGKWRAEREADSRAAD
jgi:hypothetical protein